MGFELAVESTRCRALGVSASRSTTSTICHCSWTEGGLGVQCLPIFRNIMMPPRATLLGSAALVSIRG